FDPLAAAESWISTELDLLLNPQRLSRLVEQNALPVGELFDAILRTADRAASQTPSQREIARALEKEFLNHLLQLALNQKTEPQVNAYALQQIAALEAKWKARSGNDPAEGAQNSYLLHRIEQFRRDSTQLTFPQPARIPDGSPIGE
ncbi:MAG: zinc-dependent metalloprotease, partial [Chthoniobacterales bacterium]